MSPNPAILPSCKAVRAALRPLNYEQLDRLALASGIGLGTLVKIRGGNTKNPGLETVRAFWPHIAEAMAPAPAVETDRRRADRRA